MRKFDYDLFVIGAGSGGVRAARMAANFGAKVAIVEDKYMGGTCVNVGCIPKKLLFYASHYAEDIETAKAFGWNMNEAHFDLKNFIQNKDIEIKRLNNLYTQILQDSGAKIIHGHGTLIDPYTVLVNGKHYSAERILIATGSQPNIPHIVGKQYTISSNDVFSLTTLPKKIIIVGGGYIAVEFASIFNSLGVSTTLIYRDSLFLKGFDADIRQFLATEMKKKWIHIKFIADIQSIKKNHHQLQATLADKSILTADQIMYAIGRTPTTKTLGIEQLGVKLDKNEAIIINRQYQTNISSIYAIGDVTNRINLTPVAIIEATCLVKNLYNNEDSVVDYNNIPTCIFSQPNVATVGPTEANAEKQYKNIDTYKSSFTAMKQSLSDSPEKTLIKLIVDKKTTKVIAAHMVGAEAGEIIQGISIAIKAGANKSDFDNTIGIHPTTAEEFVIMNTKTSTS